MPDLTPTPFHEIVVEFDLVTGKAIVIGSPPEVTVWSPELVGMLRATAGDDGWARIEDGPDGTDIVLGLEGGPVRYRLTGERDEFQSGLIAVLLQPEVAR